MEKNENLKPVQLPEGHMCGDCCGGCVKLNKKDVNSDGKMWCGEHSKYVFGSEPACSYFVPIDR